MDTIPAALDEAGGVPADIVYGKTFLTDVAGAGADYTRAWLDALGEVRPTSTLLGIPALLRPDMLIEIETEAIIGAAAARQNIYLQEQRERSRGYARAVAVGDAVYVSGCTAISLTGKVEAEGDWAAQSDLSHQAIERALAQAGATLDDVVRRRNFTVDGAEVNRPYGRGPRGSRRAARPASGAASPGWPRPSSSSRSKLPRSRVPAPASSGSARTTWTRSTSRQRRADRPTGRARGGVAGGDEPARAPAPSSSTRSFTRNAPSESESSSRAAA